MIVTVRMRGPLAETVGGDGQIEMKIDEENAKLRDLLTEIISTIEAIGAVWRSADEILRDALVLRNNTDVSLTGGLDTVLQEGDSIVILPLVHGG